MMWETQSEGFDCSKCFGCTRMVVCSGLNLGMRQVCKADRMELTGMQSAACRTIADCKRIVAGTVQDCRRTVKASVEDTDAGSRTLAHSGLVAYTAAEFVCSSAVLLSHSSPDLRLSAEADMGNLLLLALLLG